MQTRLVIFKKINYIYDSGGRYDLSDIYINPSHVESVRLTGTTIVIRMISGAEHVVDGSIRDVLADLRSE